MKTFDGNKLRIIREKQRKSQKELAKAIGVEQYVISNWELNRKKPSEHYQRMMAKFLFVGTFEFQEDESKIIFRYEPIGKRVMTPFNYTLFKHLRLKKGLSPADIASKIGCDAGTIRNWERGESPARISFQEKAAEVLGVPVALLSCENGTVTPEEYDFAFGGQLELPIEQYNFEVPSIVGHVMDDLSKYVLIEKEAYQKIIDNLEGCVVLKKEEHQALLDDQKSLHQIQRAIRGAGE